MPTAPAKFHVSNLASMIDDHKELAHLRVRARGATLIIESGPKDDAIPHARFRKDTVHLWTLELPDHRGRWQPTGDRGQLGQLFATLRGQYAWTLTPLI
jgi:hypothetical protein